MGIKDMNLVLGQDVEGTFYVSDKYGNLIGWYDSNIETLHIDERYKHADKLIEKCINQKFSIDFRNIEEPEVLKYFAQRRISIRNHLLKEKKINDYFDKKLQVLPSKRAVKNAEQKINKRHG